MNFMRYKKYRLWVFFSLRVNSAPCQLNYENDQRTTWFINWIFSVFCFEVFFCLENALKYRFHCSVSIFGFHCSVPIFELRYSTWSIDFGLNFRLYCSVAILWREVKENFFCNEANIFCNEALDSLHCGCFTSNGIHTKFYSCFWLYSWLLYNFAFQSE